MCDVWQVMKLSVYLCPHAQPAELGEILHCIVHDVLQWWTR